MEMIRSTILQDICFRLLENASEVINQADNSDLFLLGEKLAYYKMIDILQSELEVVGLPLSLFGLDFNIDKTFQ